MRYNILVGLYKWVRLRRLFGKLYDLNGKEYYFTNYYEDVNSEVTISWRHYYENSIIRDDIYL